MLIYLILGQLVLITSCSTIYKTVKMEVIANPVYLRNVTFKLQALSWQKSVSNMECDIVKELRNVTLHLQVFSKNDANQYHPFLVNVTHNVCNILDKKLFPTYGTIAMKLLKEVTNINHSCPYTGHLSAKNLYMDEKFLPIAFPLGMYKTVYHFMEGYPYEDIGTVMLYIQAIEKQRRG